MPKADNEPEAAPAVTYTITSDIFAGGQAGESISEESLSGCNIPALIEAGHITAQTPSEAVEATNTQEQ